MSYYYLVSFNWLVIVASIASTLVKRLSVFFLYKGLHIVSLLLLLLSVYSKSIQKQTRAFFRIKMAVIYQVPSDVLKSE